MQKLTIAQAVGATSYPGRGILAGKTPDGTRLFLAYFIMGRSVNSRNRVFVEDGEGLRTRAFDPSKLSDPSLIIYAPVRVLGNRSSSPTATRPTPCMRRCKTAARSSRR